jgi:DNA-binding beta-propeller fold protein YncE
MDVFSASGTRVKTVGALTKKPTNALGDLNGPVAAYWDEARGRLFVLERGNERIQTFDGEGNALAIHAKTSAAFDLNSDPLTDEIYVAASSAHMIEVYSKTTGRSLGAVGRFGTDEAGLNGPVSVALHENVLHIVDAGNRKIKVLTRDGRLVRSYGGNGNLVQPRSIRFDGQGRAWVSDTFGAALVVFDAEGNRLARFEPELPSSKKRAAPTSLARRSDGTIYAALIAAA